MRPFLPALPLIILILIIILTGGDGRRKVSANTDGYMHGSIFHGCDFFGAGICYSVLVCRSHLKNLNIGSRLSFEQTRSEVRAMSARSLRNEQECLQFTCTCIVGSLDSRETGIHTLIQKYVLYGSTKLMFFFFDSQAWDEEKINDNKIITISTLLTETTLH